MPIKVILQTVDGNRQDEVLDPNYSLAEIWPVGDSTFPLLQYVDPYGNSIFNRQQMYQIVEELDVLLRRVLTDEQREILLRVRALAAKCKDRPHLLLRFRGD
jgi:hypothetical protein